MFVIDAVTVSNEMFWRRAPNQLKSKYEIKIVRQTISIIYKWVLKSANEASATLAYKIFFGNKTNFSPQIKIELIFVAFICFLC